MTSLEGLIRELFFRANIWRRILFGSILCYFLLGFGYLRAIAVAKGPTPELPPAKMDRAMIRKTFSALPLGAFYTLTPLFIAWGIANILEIFGLTLLMVIPWGLGAIASLTLTAVALVIAEEDPERFFLGLEFEKVLGRWWKTKHIWLLPALGCYGFMALCGLLFFGFSAFVSLAFLVSYLGLMFNNLRYA